MIPLLFDTDIGSDIDDAVTLAYLVRELLGIAGMTHWTRDDAGPHRIATEVDSELFFERYFSIGRQVASVKRRYHRPMKTTLALSACIATTLCVAALGQTKVALPKELTSYTSWKRVNPKPLRLPDPTALLCAAPTPDRVVNPHRQYWFTVYVNPTGGKAMQKPKSPVFPIGSVVVKEKLPEKTSIEPELRTAMIKREKDFDKKAGDWEYLVIDGKGEIVRDRQETAPCRSCHEKAKESDYVFRTYLPKPAL